MAAKFSYEKYTCSGENSRADKDEKLSGNSNIFKWKNRKISNSKSQILWTMKALHVILKFHIHLRDSIH